MKTTATNKKIRELMTMLNSGTLVPQADFQRRLVWTNKHKQAFIQTVLDGMPFPEIFICDGEVNLTTGQGSQLLVDGQQRVTTLFQYFMGSEQMKPGEILPYAELEDSQKADFLEYAVVVRDLGKLSTAEIREVFRRMNSTNYSLNAMEVNNARFDGQLKRAAEEMSTWSVFDQHRVFTAVDIRRMVDLRWCLDVIITAISGYFSRSDAHEEYLELYNDDFPQQDEVLTEIQASIDLLDGLGLDDKSRAWQKNDLFTLVVEVTQLGASNCQDVNGISEALKGFYVDVNAIANGGNPQTYESARQYHIDVISGSNERARRIRRGDVIRKIIAPFFSEDATSFLK